MVRVNWTGFRDRFGPCLGRLGLAYRRLRRERRRWTPPETGARRWAGSYRRVRRVERTTLIGARRHVSTAQRRWSCGPHRAARKDRTVEHLATPPEDPPSNHSIHSPASSSSAPVSFFFSFFLILVILYSTILVQFILFWIYVLLSYFVNESERKEEGLELDSEMTQMSVSEDVLTLSLLFFFFFNEWIS